ncbi:hypothetical protein GGR52DRAFT_522122 [Hypoxylon sp. FL1284]|nr:hypothetical protein GGR52DRAFT_522122 [Hypoxylon sp. FL1284]
MIRSVQRIQRQVSPTACLIALFVAYVAGVRGMREGANQTHPVPESENGRSLMLCALEGIRRRDGAEWIWDTRIVCHVTSSCRIGSMVGKEML